MSKFLTKVKNWFVAHKPTKRRLIQVYAALLYNANIKGFFSGKIYTGDTKNLCVPGLNCYSCPGAVGACPLGALQDSLARSGKTAPAYIFGILILFGLLLGRIVCGFLCPFGLIQELLYKIRTPKLRKSRFTRIASYFKYILLIVVIAIPIIYAGIPVFCKYICPAGTLEGAVSLLSNIQNSSFFEMLGYLFTWKFCVLLFVIVASVFIYRFLCRFICPLGAIYSLFCKISLLGVKLDKDKCINCGLCIQGCKMDIKHVGDHECIQCGECISICPVQAISWKGSQIFVRDTTPQAQPVAEVGKVDLLSLSKANASATVAAPVSSAEAVSGAETLDQTLSPDQTEAIDQTEEGVAVTQDENPEKPEKPNKLKSFGVKVKSAFKKPRFVVEFVAWVVALAVLITALICYNLPENKSVLPQTSLDTYQDGALVKDGYSTTSEDKRVRVFYFWHSDLPECAQGVKALGEYAAETEITVDAVAIHIAFRDDRDVGKYIVDNGLSAYAVTFAQDGNDTNLYAFFGGDKSIPKPMVAVVAADGVIISVTQGNVDKQALAADVAKAQSSVVYREGDECPYFQLTTYQSSKAEAGQFSKSDILGKVTVLNFWYTTCDPCKHELPFFNKVFKERNGEINMYAIHRILTPEGGVQSWLNAEKDGNGKPWYDYSLTYAQDNKETNLYAMLGGRNAYPMTVIVNAQGKITKVIQGACTEQQLNEAIDEAKATP